MGVWQRILLLLSLLAISCNQLHAGATYEHTPYREEQKVVFDFYLDDPAKLATALYWLRSYINTLLDAPYGYPPESLDIKVVMHGTEIVTVAKKNYEKYRDSVERMKYYDLLGVEFRICERAAEDFGYTLNDLQDFIIVIPSAITELGHWQQEGYSLIRPIIYTKTRSIEEIR